MTGKNILVINGGSSSLKFALINDQESAPRISGLAERLGSLEAQLGWKDAAGKHSKSIAKAGHREALNELLPLVQAAAVEGLHGVGHRVVHGGEAFTGSCLIDSSVIDAIRDTIPLAPLHNPANLMGIEAALAVFPDLPQVAVFDTAFHQSLPDYAYRYAIPAALYEQHAVRRYGFHGTSHRFVSAEAAKQCQLDYHSSAWLTAHLGNGCSTCAIVDGQSRDTSMGLTPLEGVVMGTRSGDVDPNLHAHLANVMGWSLTEVTRVLNNESGLKGLSGLSNDMRTLEEAAGNDHAGAQLAIEVFCYRLAKSLASMACALPKLDGLIFTGGIGENSPLIRDKTVQHLRLLGLQLDEANNLRCLRGVAGEIQAAGSPRVLVVPTNEELQIALDTLSLIAPEGAAHA
ncbi:acetate kinase [Atopomonas sediminilitoris]|uniref:acetate kinase n=1 Tax=Atopomonas sediminilitoris TaxID=2919919 RepID=UPI001F4ECFF3|nr:acetate kinase [Atopomonas sediminilitoris]MCJ8169789.1 acetate kinase [Atopomonas sediminilitoris]